MRAFMGNKGVMEMRFYSENVNTAGVRVRWCVARLTIHEEKKNLVALMLRALCDYRTAVNFSRFIGILCS
jgi:hypothetical protein